MPVVLPARAPAGLPCKFYYFALVIELDSCYAEDRKRKDYYDSLEQMD